MNSGDVRQRLSSLAGRARSLDAHVDYWGVFRENELLVAGWAHDSGRSLDLEIRAGDALDLTSVTIVRGSRPDVAARFGGDPSERLGFVVKAMLAHDVDPTSALCLRVRSAQGEAELRLEETLRDRRDAFIASVQGYADADRRVASRLATSVLGAGAIDLGSVRLNVERAVAVGTAGVFFRGWLFDPERSVTALRLRVGAEMSDDLLATLGRLPRQDVDSVIARGFGAGSDWGMVCFARVGVPADVTHAELLVTTRNATIPVPVELTELPRDPVGMSQELLSDVDPLRVGALELLERHVAPAIEVAWQPSPPHARELRTWVVGTPPAAPRRSVVVPLYGRADFMLYQLNELARDPELAETELIYVVDDPRLTREALSFARDLHELLGTSLTLIDSGRNRGFAAATNLGARHASGRFLVLLNSDVLPARHGWLGRLERELQALPDAGPIAPRLLFHDGTLQHDGIAFTRDPAWPTLWLNDHPGKGLPASLVQGPRVERVHAVTAACLMIERELYEELGGLDERYIVGDFEDSDLCLKAAQLGRGSFVVRDETLFHLERQSQSLAGTTSWRHRLTLYNAWRHGRRWATEIERAVGTRWST